MPREASYCFVIHIGLSLVEEMDESDVTRDERKRKEPNRTFLNNPRKCKNLWLTGFGSGSVHEEHTTYAAISGGDLY